MDKYYIGVDFGIQLKWWQKLLVWFGFRNRWNDYSCAVTFKKHPDGTMEVVNYKHF